MKAAIAALVLACAACGSSNNGSPTDSGTPDSGTGQAACVTNPTTSTGILNACTDAGFVDKKPVIPNLLPDGGLPPLP